MKILVYTWKDLAHPEAGGAELNIHKHSENWIKEGAEVTFFSPEFKGSKKYEEINGIKIYRKGGKYTSYFWGMVYYLTIFRKVKFDVLIDVENGIPFFTPLYARIPSVVYIHHVHLDQFFTYFRFPMNYIGYFLEKYMMPLIYRGKHFITVSNSSKEEILKQKFTKKEVEVVYNGVDLEFYQKESEKVSTPTIMTLGRLVNYKRVDSIIRSIKIVKEQIPNVIFKIAGNGSDKERLIELVDELDLNENVEFLGFVDESKEGKVRLLSEAWAFVVFSKWEGWGLTALEAQACDTLAIVADVKGLRETVRDGDTGFLCTDGDEKELASRIIEVLSNRELAVSMGKKARGNAELFAWEKSSKKYYSILIDTISTNGK
jgi:glycosyltransferase involved in cell wall biosynthesis